MKIGLEVHIQLATKTKLFCACPVEGEENENVCPVCLGFPGSRPRLNIAAVRQALLVATVIGSKISRTTQLSRKSYFYPDLPKSFQITQFGATIATGGEIECGGRVRVRGLQIEEDPARIIYEGENVLLDHSRCGAPLVELVTEPDIKSPAQARELVEWLEAVLSREGGAGVMRGWRADANVSLKGGERVEIKNVSGSKGVERALEAEIARQEGVVASGGRVERETRTWDEARGVTVSSRSKETEADYGYILEPDIPAVDTLDVLGDQELRPEELDRLRRVAVGGSIPATAPPAKPAAPKPPVSLSAKQEKEVAHAYAQIAVEHPKGLEDARTSERALNALVGQIMKRCGTAPPPAALAEWLRKRIA